MSNKLQEFIKRNRYRNKHLYESGVVEGIDYIVCPYTQERLSMIKKSYIERILDMTVEEYDSLYPNVRGVCKSRITNIKRGLVRVDGETGLTKHELSVVKSRYTLTTVGEDGLTGDERRAIKTKESNLTNVDELGMNGYHRTAEKARPKQIKTLIEMGRISDPKDRDTWKIYREFVRYLTRKVLGIIERPDGVIGRGIGKYVLDHKYSVLRGYYDYVSPYYVSDPRNLEYILWEENSSKFTDCNINRDDLVVDPKFNDDTYKWTMDAINMMKSGGIHSIPEIYQYVEKKRESNNI